jgi:hypothetical protein
VAAGATDDEVADVLLAIALVTRLGRVVTAAPMLPPRLAMTSQPRWKNSTTADGSTG